MLVARRQNGELFSLGEHDKKSELIEWRKTERFFCPECEENVVLKLGDKRIWHFSHQKDSNCLHKYERESDYHLSGKLELYQWLLENRVNAQLEKYFPVFKQRADIAFQLHNHWYAVEYQCSTISEALFKARTDGYLANGIHPIWIIGGNQLKRTAANIVSVNQFQYLFLKRKMNRWQLLSYCPNSHLFILLDHLLPVSPRKVIASVTAFPRDKMKVLDFDHQPREMKTHLDTWVKEIQKLKVNYYQYSDSSQDPFLHELYKRGLNLQTLPPEIGLPVFSSPFIETSPLVWQMYLYIDVFRHLKEGNVFSFSNVYNSFLIRMNRQQIKLRQLPLVTKGNFKDAIDEYLALLVDLSAFKRIHHDNYQMGRPFKLPPTVDEQKEMERDFYQKYRSVIMNHFDKN